MKDEYDPSKAKRKTSFDKHKERLLKNPEVAAAYAEAGEEIAEIDQLINTAMDENKAAMELWEFLTPSVLSTFPAPLRNRLEEWRVKREAYHEAQQIERDRVRKALIHLTRLSEELGEYD